MRLVNLPAGIVIGWLFARGLIDASIILGMIVFAATILEPLLMPLEPSQEFSQEDGLHVRK